MTLDQLEKSTLSGALATPRRVELFARLTVFLKMLIATGCRANIWLDGSFTTAKPDPSDIDVAVFIFPESFKSFNAEQEAALEALLDRPTALERFGLDVYVEEHGEFHRAAYWKGIFGFCHDEVSPKGIAAVECAP